MATYPRHFHEGYPRAHRANRLHRDLHKMSEETRELHKNVQPIPDPNEKLLANRLEQVERATELVANVRAEMQATKGELTETRQQLERAVKLLDAKRPVEIIIPKTKTKTDIGVQHEMLPRLIQYASLGIPVAMKGPAGSGKTSAADAVARTLGLPMYIVPLGPQTSKSDLMGFINGAGAYVPSLLRLGYEGGGVILIDEMDAANAAVLTIINGLTANGHGGFADKMVKRHKNTIFLAAMNTFGRGADSEYLGRAKLDAATLDRWVMLEWDHDWSFVRQLAGNDEWTARVQAINFAASEARVKAVVASPRAAIYGAKLLAAGRPQEEVEHVTIWGPLAESDRAKIQARLPQGGE